MVAVARTNYPMPLTLVKLRKPAESRHFSKGQPSKQENKERGKENGMQGVLFKYC